MSRLGGASLRAFVVGKGAGGLPGAAWSAQPPLNLSDNNIPLTLGPPGRCTALWFCDSWPTSAATATGSSEAPLWQAEPLPPTQPVSHPGGSSEASAEARWGGTGLWDPSDSPGQSRLPFPSSSGACQGFWVWGKECDGLGFREERAVERSGLRTSGSGTFLDCPLHPSGPQFSQL